MTHQNEAATKPGYPVSLCKRLLQGAGIGLILILIFLFGAGEPDPAWDRLWMIRPLAIVPLAGAAGAGCFYFLDHMRYQRGWKKAPVYILSVIIFIVGLWLGTVLGLAGTMWH